MEKEIKELSKPETSAESEYPEELREQAETALLLVAVKHTRLDCKTSSTLAKLKRKFLGAPSHDQPQTEDSRNHLEGGTIDLASRNHLEGGTIDLAPRNLSGELPLGRPEHILRMLKCYNPPDIPSVPSLNNELIERCSKPFEKQLSASDLKDSQSRLTISKSDAENHLYPLLNEGENLARGIEELK